MDIIRIVGCEGEIKIYKSIIFRWTKKGRFFIEGDACSKNCYSGMRLEHLGQFNQCRNSHGLYEMYTTPIYFGRDYNKFRELYLHHYKNALWVPKKDRELIRDWVDHSLDFDAGWLSVSLPSVEVFIRTWLKKEKISSTLEEIFDGDISDYEMWFEDLPKIKKYLRELKFYEKH